MQACLAHAQFRSTFTGQTNTFQANKRHSRISALLVRQPTRKFGVYAKIDTGYKQAGSKSTVQDQLHEAEIDKNASAFVKEFKEDLGATGENKSSEDKKDTQERQDDKLGLKRDEKDAHRSAESKK